jgi:hypothetical protein
MKPARDRVKRSALNRGPKILELLQSLRAFNDLTI